MRTSKFICCYILLQLFSEFLMQSPNAYKKLLRRIAIYFLSPKNWPLYLSNEYLSSYSLLQTDQETSTLNKRAVHFNPHITL